MGGELVRQFIELQRRMNKYEYLISTIAFFAAPTIEGKKPSSLISFSNNKYELNSTWQMYKYKACAQLGVDFYELVRDGKHILVLFYKPVQLKAYLNAKSNSSFLEYYGYTRGMNLNENLQHLETRFKDGCPHEIGVFLGIPLDDVKGFIETGGENCLLNGYWKVYSSIERAKTYFNIYDKSRIQAVKNMLNGSLYHITQ